MATGGLALLFYPPLHAALDMTNRRMVVEYWPFYVGAFALLAASFTVAEKA